jgi:hypothetical protein
MAPTQPSDSDSSSSKVDATPQKRLTVTFEDLGIHVFGLGEDFGSTCLSVVWDIFRFGDRNKSKRVGYKLICARTWLTRL